VTLWLGVDGTCHPLTRPMAFNSEGDNPGIPNPPLDLDDFGCFDLELCTVLDSVAN
jgi:hypothetical protein